jgi:hydrogenase maturation protease
VRPVLIIGFGNVARSDDGAGVRAAHQLEEIFCGHPGVRVIAAHELAPELAEDIAEAARVLFLDAATGILPGKIAQTYLVPNGTMGPLGHNVTPAALLFCAEQLYGEAPPAIRLTITAGSVESGTLLSAQVADRIDEFVRRALALVRSWLGEEAGVPLASCSAGYSWPESN